MTIEIHTWVVWVIAGYCALIAFFLLLISGGIARVANVMEKESVEPEFDPEEFFPGSESEESI